MSNTQTQRSTEEIRAELDTLWDSLALDERLKRIIASSYSALLSDSTAVFNSTHWRSFKNVCISSGMSEKKTADIIYVFQEDVLDLYGYDDHRPAKVPDAAPVMGERDDDATRRRRRSHVLGTAQEGTPEVDAGGTADHNDDTDDDRADGDHTDESAEKSVKTEDKPESETQTAEEEKEEAESKTEDTKDTVDTKSEQPANDDRTGGSEDREYQRRNRNIRGNVVDVDHEASRFPSHLKSLQHGRYDTDKNYKFDGGKTPTRTVPNVDRPLLDAVEARIHEELTERGIKSKPSVSAIVTALLVNFIDDEGLLEGVEVSTADLELLDVISSAQDRWGVVHDRLDSIDKRLANYMKKTNSITGRLDNMDQMLYFMSLLDTALVADRMNYNIIDSPREWDEFSPVQDRLTMFRKAMKQRADQEYKALRDRSGRPLR